MKPLGIKNYGSIPHLPNSRMGSGDHHCSEGQARIATVKTRDRHDHVIVQEKLDGGNVGIALHEGVILPLVRSGYLASSSPYPQHHRFAEWVYERQDLFFKLLKEGERIVGEWLYQAHGTRYKLTHEPFVAFDLMAGIKRASYDEFCDRVAADLTTPFLIHRGDAFSVANALKAIEVSGHGAIDPVEGAVWRVERKGAVDFLCKYVRPDKIDGKYLSEISGLPAVINQKT